MGAKENKMMVANIMESGLQEKLLSGASDLNPTEQVIAAFDAGLLPDWVETPQQAIILAQYGKELNMPPLIGISMMYIIGNSPALTSRGMGYLLRRQGINYEVIRDNEMVYETDNPRNFYLEGEFKKDDKGNLIPLGQITTIKMTRPNSEATHYIHFSWADAERAELTSKNTWVKYPKDMMFARCLSKAARRVAPDVIGGWYLADELDDTGTIGYSSEGNIIKVESMPDESDLSVSTD